MGAIERACAWAKAIAYDDSHGYDQGSRWGPDYDCSSMVISSWKQAGVPLTCTYTGNMKQDMLRHGFRDVTAQVNLATGAGLQAGDVLLHETQHTALYIGNGQVVNAGGNENGGITGGKTGDQTGREIRVIGYFNHPWQCVLRFTEKEEKPADQVPATAPTDKETPDTYVVKSGESLWTIAGKFGTTVSTLAALNNIKDPDRIWVGDVLKIPKAQEKPPKQDQQAAPRYNTVTVKVKAETLERWQKEAGSMSLGEYLDEVL